METITPKNEIIGSFFIYTKDSPDPIKIKKQCLIPISFYFEALNNSPLSVKNGDDTLVPLLEAGFNQTCLKWLQMKYENEFEVNISSNLIENICEMARYFSIIQLQKLCDDFIVQETLKLKEEYKSINPKDEKLNPKDIFVYSPLINNYDFLKNSIKTMLEIVDEVNTDFRKEILSLFEKEILLEYIFLERTLIKENSLKIVFKGFHNEVYDRIDINQLPTSFKGCRYLTGLEFRTKTIEGLPPTNIMKRPIVFASPENWGSSAPYLKCIAPNQILNYNDLGELNPRANYYCFIMVKDEPLEESKKKSKTVIETKLITSEAPIKTNKNWFF